jgi:hypothetical protein
MTKNGISYNDCTMDLCPVQASIYGYNPSKPANIAFCIIFGVSFFVHLFQGIKWKSWAFMVSLLVGIFAEVLGYAGRVIMNNDYFNKTAFKIQIICLTVAPAFLTAGIYLTLKHTYVSPSSLETAIAVCESRLTLNSVIVFGASFSRIKPNSYTWVFVGKHSLSRFDFRQPSNLQQFATSSRS